MIYNQKLLYIRVANKSWLKQKKNEVILLHTIILLFFKYFNLVEKQSFFLFVPFPIFDASSCTHDVLITSTSTLAMYSSTSTSTVLVIWHEYRVHASTSKNVLEYTSTRVLVYSCPTLDLSLMVNSLITDSASFTGEDQIHEYDHNLLKILDKHTQVRTKLI